MVGNWPRGGSDSAGAGDPAGRLGRWLPVLVPLGNLVLAGLLVGAACLRETPAFWTQAGGYPVALRFVVRFGFFRCGRWWRF